MLTEWSTVCQEPRWALCTQSCSPSVQQLWGWLPKVTRLRGTFRVYLSLASIPTIVESGGKGENMGRGGKINLCKQRLIQQQGRELFITKTHLVISTTYIPPLLLSWASKSLPHVSDSALWFRVMVSQSTYTSACWPKTEQGCFTKMRSVLLSLPHLTGMKTEAVTFTSQQLSARRSPWTQVW